MKEGTGIVWGHHGDHICITSNEERQEKEESCKTQIEIGNQEGD